VSNTGAGALICNASVAAPPTLRAEGMTDQIGDIVITCTGGITAAPGSGALPVVNFTVSLGTNVTSRLLSNGGAFSGSCPGGACPSNTSEALLMIDEPGTVAASSQTPLAAGVGGNAAQTLCANSAIGAGYVGLGNNCSEYPVATACTGPACGGLSTITVMSSSSSSLAAPYNIFVGLVSGNQVTFEGIPILPPATTGLGRVYRITNVRANISGLSAGLAGTTPLTASVSISNYVAVNNPVQTAGFIQAGLSSAVRNKSNSGSLSTNNRTLLQCDTNGIAGNGSSSPPQGLFVAQYTKNFGTAFKTRYLNSGVQNIPGTIYQAESGFILPAATGLSFAGQTTAGLADYGTRLKAAFNNVPTGVRIFVSTSNLPGNGGTANEPTMTLTANNTPFAVLVTGETTTDGVVGGVPPVVTATTSVNSGGFTSLAELPVVNGSTIAVWEVVNTNPAALESLNFGIWELFTSNAAANSPPAGTGTVNLSYAPNPTNGAFTASAGTTASSTLTLPRFADTSTATNFITIAICVTDLLFPFVTNQSGFDTGIAIANTTADPFSGTTNGTAGAQSGACTLSWYTGTTNPAPTNTGTIASGTVYTTLASVAVPGFQGYMIAVCNFQYAHGFAFVSDIGAQRLAMGYLADILGSNSSDTATTEPRGTPTAEYSGH